MSAKSCKHMLGFVSPTKTLSSGNTSQMRRVRSGSVKNSSLSLSDTWSSVKGLNTSSSWFSLNKSSKKHLGSIHSNSIKWINIPNLTLFYAMHWTIKNSSINSITSVISLSSSPFPLINKSDKSTSSSPD